MSSVEYLDSIEQGSQQWLSLRKSKITATDSATILGLNPWKTPMELYEEKISPENKIISSAAMQRGTDLEPHARNLFCALTGHRMIPRVAVKGWAMASLDGINEDGQILEIKCPGAKTHAIAVSGKVPSYYYPQLQHQMYVCDSQKAFYFSFDGFDGVTVEVNRDDLFIERMLVEELKFYDCLVNKTPPKYMVAI